MIVRAATTGEARLSIALKTPRPPMAADKIAAICGEHRPSIGRASACVGSAAAGAYCPFVLIQNHINTRETKFRCATTITVSA